MSSNATNVSILEPWNPEVVRAHEISILVIVGVFGTLSTVLLGISLKNGWEELNGKGFDLAKWKSYFINLIFIGSYLSPIFSRFFRSSLDYKYFQAVANENITNPEIRVPTDITMSIYAISIFGMCMSLPIIMVIYKFSKNKEAYLPSVTKVRIILAMTILHLTVDIPSLICEYFYVDKFITAKPEVFVPMKSILAVIENVFAGISIIMVEVKSQSLQQLGLAERVMIMRFAFGGLVLYLISNTTRCTLTLLQAYKWQVIPRGCVIEDIDDGKFIANPFQSSCLNYAELALITFACLATIIAFVVLISNMIMYQRLNSYQEMAPPTDHPEELPGNRPRECSVFSNEASNLDD
ncbi:Oidioi.mRNA.OKI2018_I69.XSR.g15270.t1.cds [Oikopleura dioica]|uniref:Oidioi.mRNA.OKI2018_I69.XSR.g15270.t1.cds n=1 Tax=Oikopleura dioica TaxID=34765 RepID=A0ABN7SHC8_OIKDI|nr:Oidioi.mRNA.OKI2018_I69.XSR.g15270.t1.cds [Oikopleura dioica]